jgi:hypothetical protein
MCPDVGGTADEYLIASDGSNASVNESSGKRHEEIEEERDDGFRVMITIARVCTGMNAAAAARDAGIMELSRQNVISYTSISPHYLHPPPSMMESIS